MILQCWNDMMIMLKWYDDVKMILQCWNHIMLKWYDVEIMLC